MKRKQSMALLLAVLLLIGCVSGCGKKEGDESGSSLLSGLTTQKADSEQKKENYRYTFHVDSFVMPEDTKYMHGLGVAGDTAYIAAEMKGGSTTQIRSYVNTDGQAVEKEVSVPCTRNAVLKLDLGSGSISEATEFALAQLPDGWEGSVKIGDLHCASDGSLWVSIVTEATWYDLPEGFDPESGDKTDYLVSEDNLTLYHYSLSGEELASFQVPKDYSGEFRLSAADQPIRADNGALICYQPDGSVCAEISDISPLLTTSDCVLIGGNRDAFVCQRYDAAGKPGDTLCSEVDISAGKLGASYPAPGEYAKWHSGNGDYDLFKQDFNSTEVYGFRLADGSSEKAFDWMVCGIERTNVLSWQFLSDGRIAVLSGSGEYNPASREELLLMTPVDPSSVKEKTVLTVAGFNVQADVRRKILEFNRSSDTHQLVLNDFNDSQFDTATCIQRLNTQVLAGNIPDIFIGGEIPTSRYAASGLLTDLYTLIDADPDMDRSDLMTEVLTPLERDGHLFELPLYFGISTALTSSFVADQFSTWRVEDVQEAMKLLVDGARYFSPLYTRSNGMSIVENQVGNYLDWSTKTCSLNSESFQGLLKFAALFPADDTIQEVLAEIMGNDFSALDDYASIASGKQLMVSMNLLSLRSYIVNGIGYSIPVTFAGYPSEDGSFGSTFSTRADVAISDSCQDKAVAWEFVSSLLTPEVLDPKDVDSEFPILRSSMEKCYDMALNYQYEVDANGNTIVDDSGEPILKPMASRASYASPFPADYEVRDEDGTLLEALKPNDPMTVNVYRLSRSDMDTLRDLIARTTRVQNTDPLIMNIINEECVAYFAGEKTVEQTTDMIQNRVNVYMMEQD